MNCDELWFIVIWVIRKFESFYDHSKFYYCKQERSNTLTVISINPDYAIDTLWNSSSKQQHCVTEMVCKKSRTLLEVVSAKKCDIINGKCAKNRLPFAPVPAADIPNLNIKSDYAIGLYSN